MRRLALAVLFVLALVPEAGAQSPATALPATAPSAPEVAMREHPDRVVDYLMKASLDPVAHTVHGEGTITWTNVSRAPVTELWLHLYLNAFKNQSSTWMRAPVGGFRGSILPKEWGTIDVRTLTLRDGADKKDLLPTIELHRKDDADETDARVPLPRPIAAGETITLDMIWDDKLPSVVERTGFEGSFHMVAQWFPKIAKIEADGTFAHFAFQHLGEFYADYGKYDVTLDVPQNFIVGAIGPAVESKVENGRRIERHVQDDIHDFSWTAWDKFQKREETIDGVATTILYPADCGRLAEEELATMRFALPHYGARYGKYPYGVLTLVHPPANAEEAGGMEYPTLITTGGSALTPPGLNVVELTTIHEFGHQYFYGLLGSHEVLWAFLDEGLNSYAEAEALRAWKGPSSATSLLGLSVGDAEIQSERARHYAQDDPVAQPVWAFSSGQSYGSLVYARTLSVLETLRRVYGPDLMNRTMGTYARRFRFQHPVPDDLLETIKAGLGATAAEMVRTALFDRGWVDYGVESISSHPERASAGLFDVGGKRETVPSDKETPGKYAGWALIVRRGTLKIPVDIELRADDGTKTTTHWDGNGDFIRVPYSGSSPLRAAVVDPEQRILLDQNPENDYLTASGHATGGAPRTLERTTYWAELLTSLVAP